MRFFDELLLILGLSMDGFAASVCMGMAAGKRIGPIVGIMSGFHVAMLLLGYVVGVSLPDSLAAIYPWAAALLLTGVGINMIREAGQAEEEEACGQTTVTSIAALSLATSIDAMTVGVAFAVMEVPPLQAGSLVALVMGTLSVCGAAFGSHVGRERRKAARTAGGVILCLLGLKLLLGAIGVIHF